VCAQMRCAGESASERRRRRALRRGPSSTCATTHCRTEPNTMIAVCRNVSYSRRFSSSANAHEPRHPGAPAPSTSVSRSGTGSTQPPNLASSQQCPRGRLVARLSRQELAAAVGSVREVVARVVPLTRRLLAKAGVHLLSQPLGGAGSGGCRRWRRGRPGPRSAPVRARSRGWRRPLRARGSVRRQPRQRPRKVAESFVESAWASTRVAECSGSSGVRSVCWWSVLGGRTAPS
jgi:hypothetical protein